MMKSIASMLFVLAAVLLLSNPAQARYADGMNTYAAYHVMHGGLDPMGTEIITTCPIDGWLVQTKGVEGYEVEDQGNDKFRYYGKPSYMTDRIDSEIIGRMIESPLVFTIEGDDASSCIESLEVHIDVRSAAVRIAERMSQTNFSTTPGSVPVFVGTADDRANRPEWVDEQADIWSRRTRFQRDNHIFDNPEQWEMPCSTCINFIMFRTPGAELSVLKESNVWIPGDRGYLYNLDHVGYRKGGDNNEDGHEGENIMYLGNDRYFGLIANINQPKEGNIKSKRGWEQFWADGRPVWSNSRQFPLTGIESVKGNDYVTPYPFDKNAE